MKEEDGVCAIVPQGQQGFRPHVIGMGILVSDREVLTCAHVLGFALGLDRLEESPAGAVRVCFVFHPAEVCINGKVDPARWFPPKESLGREAADVAVILLDTDAPAEVGRAILKDYLTDVLAKVYGYRSKELQSGNWVSHPYGEWAKGEIAGPQPRNRAQFDGRKEGASIEKGYSGGSVYDPAQRAVVGMIVQRDRDEASRIAQFIEAESLIAALGWPLLSETVAGASAAPGGPLIIAPSRLPTVGWEWVARGKELGALDEAWRSSGDQKTNTVLIVAPGGIGKTSLVQRWRQQLALANFAGARRALDWSFYSQGVRDADTEMSADLFFDWALRWFGESAPGELKDPWQMGWKLAECVRRSRTLLILDGLEPLQHPPGPLEGQLKHLGLRALITSLTEQNPGLLVLTSREDIVELNPVRPPMFCRFKLESLDPDAGAALLARYGVHGDPDELRAASVEFNGHALALVLLGTFLKEWCSGDVKLRTEHLQPLLEGDESTVRHARRMVRSYEAWFERGKDEAAVSLLRLLGLFDRPAEWHSIMALTQTPPIVGLTEPIVSLKEKDLFRVMSRLRRAGLVQYDTSISPPPPSLDCHPLIRECESDTLKSTRREAWRDAHRRLYEHLSQSTQEHPKTLRDMMPLYNAIVHGCKAGIRSTVVDRVLKRRVWREGQDYSLMVIGAHATEASTLSAIFEGRWDAPIDGLDDATRVDLLFHAGLFLCGAGRLPATIKPLEVCLGLSRGRGDWGMASITAMYLSAYSSFLGHFAQAILYGEQSLDLSRNASPAIQKACQTLFGCMMHWSGKWELAATVFESSASIPEVRAADRALEYSFHSFYYAEFLLDRAQSQRAYDLAVAELAALEPTDWYLAKGLYNMVAGKALLAAVGPADQATVRRHLDAAVDLVQQSGMHQHLPDVLVAHAVGSRAFGDLKSAEADLAKAYRISADCSLVTAQIDMALEQIRLCLATNHRETASEKLDWVLRAIASTDEAYTLQSHEQQGRRPINYIAAIHEGTVVGYHRHDARVAELQKSLAT